jgi:hypothetical protein
MDNSLILLPFLVALAVVLFGTHRRVQVQCPDCGDPLPVIYSPFKKTRRMWRAGGYLCARCGCETDMVGRKVTADTPLPPVPVRRWALLSVSLLVGLGLGTALWFVPARALAAPPTVVAPPIIAPPEQVLPLAPAD